MEIGVGLDATLGLSLEEQAQLAQEAARLGYTSIWTPEGTGDDAFQICGHRWAASREVVPEGLVTGIAVSPVALRTPVGLAMSSGTLSTLTGGRFILGIGTGGAYNAAYRRSFGLAQLSALALMRDYLTTTRALLAGEVVTYEGSVVKLRGVKLGVARPQRTPVYLGALGPEMLRLGGELADGVALNWCTPQQVAWSRERVMEGAARVARNPADVKVVEYIRVCVDDDIDVARRAFTRSVIGYALGRASGRERSTGYRAHFERMGFAEALTELDRMRDLGASPDQIVDAVPPELLHQVGYYGPPAGAAAAFRRIAEGLDVAIVRVVAASPGVRGVLATMRACQPGIVSP